jgi:hypothetical protein
MLTKSPLRESFTVLIALKEGSMGCLMRSMHNPWLVLFAIVSASMDIAGLSIYP